jgi:hypothetical protein
VDENQTTLAKDDYVSAIYENEWFIKFKIQEHQEH